MIRVQPVATDEAPPRSPDEIASVIGRHGTVVPPISFAEGQEFLAWARRRERHALTKIEIAVAKGPASRAARRAVQCYRKQLATRFVALWEATPRDRRGGAHHSTHERQWIWLARFESVLHRVRDLLQMQVRPKARLTAKAKSLGGYRPIFSFGWTDQARFRLLASSLFPFAGFHASQYQLRWHPEGRGRQAACEALLDRLNRLSGVPSHEDQPDTYPGPVAGDYVFLQIDVRNYFGSIKGAWLQSHPFLDGDLKRHVFTDNLMVKVSKEVRGRLGGAYDSVIRSGLPQGSALSALVAEWVMADILKGLACVPDGVFLFTYCDNIGVLAPKEQAPACVELIRRTFGSSEAGSFDLTESKPVPATGGFRFLGLEFLVKDGTARAEAPVETVDQASILLLSEISRAVAPQDFRTLKMIVCGKAADWRLWGGAADWRDQMLNAINEAQTVMDRLTPSQACHWGLPSNSVRPA